MMNKFDSLKKRLERATEGKERDVAKRYALLFREINSLLSNYYRKYEIDGKLTYMEMVKYQRLEKMLKEINELINESEKTLRNEIRRHLREQFSESYYQTSFILETTAQAKIGYSALRNEVIDEAIYTAFTGLTLNERLSKRRADLIYSMRETITRGLIEGQTYRGMANIIKDELEGDLAKANRIVRTESHRIREAASLNSVKFAESKGIIMKKTWNTVKDERVRNNHARLDGKTLSIDKLFKIDGYEAEAPGQFGFPEMDINCRCYLAYEIVDVKKPQHEELADLTYAEWRKERLA